MLIFTRKNSEVIHIGDEIQLVVLEIKGSYVRLGINAPDNVQIDREEIRTKKLDTILDMA